MGAPADVSAAEALTVWAAVAPEVLEGRTNVDAVVDQAVTARSATGQSGKVNLDAGAGIELEGR